MAVVDPFWRMVLRRFRGGLLATSMASLALTIDLGFIDLPAELGAVVVGLLVLGVGTGLRLQLHDLLWTMRQCASLVIPVVIALGVLAARGISRHLAKDAQEHRDRSKLDSIVDGQRRIETACSQCNAKMDRILSLAAKGSTTGKDLANAIGIGDCVAPFNLGWKAFLTDGTQILRESPVVSGSDPRFKVDWSGVRILGNKPSEIVVLSPDVFWGPMRILHVGFGIGRGRPCGFSEYFNFGSGTLGFGGGIIDGSGPDTLTVVGVEGTLK